MFFLVCLFSREIVGEEHSRQKEHKNILCEGPVLNLNFSLRPKDI